MNNKSYISRIKNLLLAGLFLTVLGSCTNEPDGEDLYTATGKTITEYIKEDADLSNFFYIISRIGLDKSLAAYGQFTCYAPTNAGVDAYVDSLWNDPKARIPHNGMISNSLEGLTDSLCSDIAYYHLINGLLKVTDMSPDATSDGSRTYTTSNDYEISIGISKTTGRITLNGSSSIIPESSDIEAVNGIFHKIDRVIQKSTTMVPDVLESMEEYSIFFKALQKTGLDDLLKRSTKGRNYVINDRTDTNGDVLYAPTICKIGYTIFAEPNSVFEKAGISGIEQLIEKTHEWYGDAAQWYDYINETGNTVSMSDDYKNPFNTLNMFVRYHILYAKMAADQLVFEESSGNNWNYIPIMGGEPYDYYETMLPNTLMKIWEPQRGVTSTNASSRNLYINRYRSLNGLTDEIGTLGSSSMHTVKNGVMIDRNLNRQAYNGYIHKINDILLYDRNVPKGVLYERMRFDATTFLVEFINNGIRNASMKNISTKNAGGSGARVAFPSDYFDNVVVYNGEDSPLRYNVKGAYRAYQADAFQGWGKYDLAIKLPHVPTGKYELRLFYSPMDHGGFMQFYLGDNTTDRAKMQILGLPLDVRVPGRDERIGWTPYYEEEDHGMASDKALRNRGFMRAPCTFMGHPEKTDEQTDTLLRSSKNCRGDGTITLRKLFDPVEMKQSHDYWFRFKNMITSGSTDLKWQLDFIELVPIDVVNNDMYEEDWM